MTRCTLPLGQVDLYAVEWPTLSAASIAHLASMLEPEDHERLARLRQPHDQTRFQVARGMLRALSAIYLPDTQHLTLGYSDMGKPFWHGETGLEFNLSHSGDWVVLGFTRNNAIGVDIQEMRPLKNIKGNADIAFHSNEIALLDTCCDHNLQTDTYYQIWSLREAGLKSIGSGLFALRQEYCTLPLPCRDWEQRKFTGTNAATVLMSRQVDIATDYTSAVAVTGSVPPHLNIMGTTACLQIIAP